MKNILSVAAVVLLMGAGCASQTNTGASVDTAPVQAGANVTVETDSGITVEVGTETDVKPPVRLTAAVRISASGAFSPATITVKKGTNVTWTNDGKDGVWVASAPHPVHTDYPGFDSMDAIGAGASYSFTFDKVGTWKYHDHLNPSVFGQVVVTE